MELTKEVKIEVIAELLKKIVEIIANSTGISPEVMLPMMKKINNNDSVTMDQVYSMAAKGFYNRIYEPNFIKFIIPEFKYNNEELSEL